MKKRPKAVAARGLPVSRLDFRAVKKSFRERTCPLHGDHRTLLGPSTYTPFHTWIQESSDMFYNSLPSL